MPFDLLGNLSNVRRTINAQGRTETWYSVTPQYAMLHAPHKPRYLLFPSTVAATFGITDPEILASCRFPFICFSVFYLCFAILAVYSTVSFQLMGHVVAKFMFIFGLGVVVYFFMFAFSLISPEMLWWGFPLGGVSILVLSFVFGYMHYKKNSMLTMFTLVDKMPDGISMIIESAGAPNSVILDDVKLHMMRETPDDLSKEEIRKIILTTVPHKVEYRYMFGLNITEMSWHK